MRVVRLTIPLLLAFALGIFGLGLRYVPHPWAGSVRETFGLWSVLIGGVAMILGAYSMIRLHTGRIRRKQEGWGYSIFFFAGLAIMVLAAAHNGGQWLFNSQVAESFYQWLYDGLYVSAGATMFSLLGFFIASAAIRTFRARSFEATVLLAAAIIVMLGRVPLGEMIHDDLPRVADWLMRVPNTAAKRGTMLGVSLGAIATSLRIIFGVERAYLGGGE